MKELLKQLASFDSNIVEYNQVESQSDIDEDTFVFPDHGTVICCEDLPANYPGHNAIIQGATQQAIEARGWQWNVLVDVTGVYKADLCIDNDVTDQLESSSPAEALLSAYLEALKAVEVEG